MADTAPTGAASKAAVTAPTVAILSLREIRPVANYGGLREAEDALVEALSAGLYRVVLSSPRFSKGTLSRPITRSVLSSSRVVRPYRIEHHQRHGGEPSDVLLVLARDFRDAAVLVGLPDWHKLGRKVLVHVEQVNDRDLRRHADVVTHLRRRVDALFTASEMPPLSHLRTLDGRLSTVDVVPPMLDVLAFSQPAEPAHRTIDVFCPDPVPAGQNELLRQWAVRNDGSYQADIGQLGAVTSLDQHRKIFTSMATRARLFLTNHRRYGRNRRGIHRGVDTRFFEAMAAGCVLVGDLPVESRIYGQYVRPAAPLLLRSDADDLPGDVVAALEDPEHSTALGWVARSAALRGNDVSHRWVHMAALAGVPLSPGIHARLKHLAELAELGEPAPDTDPARSAGSTTETRTGARHAAPERNGSAGPGSAGDPDAALDRP